MDIDYFVSAAPEQAQALLAQAAEALGYTVEPQPSGVWALTRGSAAMTALFGAMAGKKRQRLRFTASFFTAEGHFVARLSRDTGGGAMAGAIGVSRSTTAFNELDQAIGQAFADAGVLANVARA